MIKKISFFLLLLISTSIFSQEVNLEKYQYIIVANKFDFLKKIDQYQTSSLTKFLLEKKGFKVFLEDETIPEELVNNRCLSLFAKVIDESNMFNTKNRIQLEDCYGKVLYTSNIGKSKEKVYKKAFQEAIRRAYESMEDFEYSYNAKAAVIDTKITATAVSSAVIATQASTNTSNNTTIDVLYAQSVENGFQLVNKKPEVIYVILKTNSKDRFIFKDKSGSITKKNDVWVAEFYEDGKLQVKEYQIKF